MKTLREYALEAWAQEQRKQSERKKRKRRAKKIEEDIDDDLLPRDAEGLQFERDLDDPSYLFSERELNPNCLDPEGR